MTPTSAAGKRRPFLFSGRTLDPAVNGSLARGGSGEDFSAAGFTLVELLIVVIVIGILAAIALPVYLGVRNNANDAGARSDLIHDKVAITSYSSSTNGNIPEAISDYTLGAVAANPATGAPAVNLIKSGWAKSSTTTTLEYRQSGANGNAGVWCLNGTSVSSNAYWISSNTKVSEGSCPSSSSDW